ncbi:MAG: NUDIX domain-containing protein, partial [Acidobacteria bacterium]|nr:NUDIX domain-containing protein [Acidobacteriota bacterium]
MRDRMIQQVLTIPANKVDDLYKARSFYDDTERIKHALDAVDDFGSFVERSYAEKSLTLRQVVACAVVRNHGSLLCLRRTRKTNRPSLRLRHTVMLGGHVDEQDASGLGGLRNCIRRELYEELGITLHREPELIGVVADPETQVGV